MENLALLASALWIVRVLELGRVPVLLLHKIHPSIGQTYAYESRGQLSGTLIGTSLQMRLPGKRIDQLALFTKTGSGQKSISCRNWNH